MKLRTAIILDNMQIAEWQNLALIASKKNLDVVMLLNCNNTNVKRDFVKNFFYYVINFFSIKNNLTKKKEFQKIPSKIIDFNSVYQAGWQILPENVYNNLKKEKIDIVIKFGMGLLKIDQDKISIPILSFHHGDPSKYRGRPAGFYEMLHGEETIGLIVQELTNKLDAGKILAYGSSKIVNFSYKRTLLGLYKNSEYILNKAIINFSNGNYLEHQVDGKNYKLPSNNVAFKFIIYTTSNLIKRLVYGLFYEKKWKVATVKNNILLGIDNVILSSELRSIPIKPNYNFYADPFFSSDGKKIRLEALDSKTGLGDVLQINLDDFSNQKPIMSGKHYSYPYSFYYQGTEYLLLEVASHSPQYICKANEPKKKISYINGLEKKRIVDATLFKKGGYFYLFFGDDLNAHTVLNLWISKSPFGKFFPHPMNPISISPTNARMGGNLEYINDKLIRFGQNNSGEYGKSIAIMEVIKLTNNTYEEKQIGTVSIDNFNGPHTLNFDSSSNTMLVDYYENKFSLFAGLRRIKFKLKKT